MPPSNQSKDNQMNYLVKVDPDPVQSTSEESKISTELLEDFYNGQNIFITGGTGFVGKVLIEKLLYEFPTIGTIYVMIRPKSGQLIRKRLQELIDCQVFDRLRNKYPERFLKLQAINGDIRFPGLGINSTDIQTLIENVSIIFHSAATIRFDEPLKYALTINTLGTKRVVQLAKKLNNLRAFVHVSTAYCTVNKRNIEEKVYYEPISPDKVLEMADWMDDATMDRLTEALYRGRPCSYHYTKSLAEHLLAQEVANGYYQSPKLDSDQISSSSNTKNWRSFPAAIVRPSIITPSWQDPFPGWIDNYNGTTGFMVVSGKGVLRSLHVYKDYQCDMIPVDVVINTCILSAWYVAIHHYCNENGFPKTLTNDENNLETFDDIFVVNCVSGILNPITWSQMRDISIPLMCKYPSMEMFRVPCVRYHESQFMNKINVYLEHTIPAFVVDFLFKFMGLTPILDRVYQKVHRATLALEFFTTNEWTYSGCNMLRLSEALKNSYLQHRCSKKCSHVPQDHQDLQQEKLKSSGSRFSVDLRELKWADYFRDYVLGIRRYLLKEDPATIPQAQNQLLMMYILAIFGKVLTTGTLFYQLMYPRSMTRKWIRRLTRLSLDSSSGPVLPFLSLSSLYGKIFK